jgi:hypothetical protein
MSTYAQNGNGNFTKSQPPLLPASDLDLIDSIASEVTRAFRAQQTAPQPAPSPVSRGEDSSWMAVAAALEDLVLNNAELREAFELAIAKSVRVSMAAAGEAVPSVGEFRAFLKGESFLHKGGTVARAFFWGFHIQVSHDDLQAFLHGAGSVNTIVDAIGGSVPSPAQPWIKLAAGFVAGALGLLGSLDRGRGVYVSMSWFAPGIFIPTSV